jgi:GT2 family glycosyltransferase
LETTAIIVNYRESSLTLRAVQSVFDSESIGPVKVAVVDNSEDPLETEKLRTCLPSSVSLWISPQNVGFGRACNLAFEQCKGKFLFLINPDARLLPGCLLRLQRTLLSKKDVGGVSPQIYFDEELSCYLPPCCPPALILHQNIVELWNPRGNVSRLLSTLWRYHAIRVWRSRRPIRVSNLSGGMALLKREAVEKAGGLFDPRFFLYYEDVDLCIRMKRAGYTLLINPEAKAIHFYDQCGTESWEKKQSHMINSRKLFLKKYSTHWSAAIRRVLGPTRPVRQGSQGRSLLPNFTYPFELQIPTRLQKGFLFEWSPMPNFVPAAGLFQKGVVFKFPENWWSNLRPGIYFGRLGPAGRLGAPFQEISWLVDRSVR